MNLIKNLLIKNHSKVLKLRQLERGKRVDKWDKVFKNGPSKIFEGFLPEILLGPFLKTFVPDSKWSVIFLESNPSLVAELVYVHNN